VTDNRLSKYKTKSSQQLGAIKRLPIEKCFFVCLFRSFFSFSLTNDRNRQSAFVAVLL